MNKQELIDRLNDIYPSSTGMCESTMSWIIYCHDPWLRINLSDRMVWLPTKEDVDRLAQYTDLFERDSGSLYWLRLKPTIKY
jgi:hypothetical protein